MLESAVTILIVACAAAYLIWTLVRAVRSGESACSGGCGCAGARKDNLGERRQIVSLNTESKRTGT